MSTHGILGIKMPDNTIQACYVHYDGDSLYSRVNSYLRSGHTTTDLAIKILSAQSVGGLRSFEIPISHRGGPRPDEYLEDDEPYVIDDSNWDKTHLGATYKVLVDYKTGKVDLIDIGVFRNSFY